jgi:hypothetical protein
MVAYNQASLLVHHEFVNELLMAVLIKIIVFWDMIPCCLVEPISIFRAEEEAFDSEILNTCKFRGS